MRNLYLNIILVVVLQSLSAAINAHLLNMTEATFTVNAEQQVEVTVLIDLLRSTDGPKEYYELAMDPNSQEYAKLFEKLALAINITQGKDNIPLAFKSANPLQSPVLNDFEDPFEWPRISVVLGSDRLLKSLEHPLTVTFRPSFVFEEPISVTLIGVVSGQRMSRWLITDQPSPKFRLADTSTSNEEFDVKLEALKSSFILGVKHILPSGTDHLLFLLVLVLLIRGIKDLIFTVALFTAAHSITMGVAAFRIIELNSLLVELGILSSIGLLGAFTLFNRPLKHGTLIIILFGLVHGLGFANAFRDSMAEGFFFWRLLGFNLGIEVAQFIFITAVSILFYTLNKLSLRADNARRVAATLTVVIACWWIGKLI